MNTYDEDLAYIHHRGFTAFAETAGGRLIGLLGELGVTSGLVVELGCGSGVTSRRLTEAGYQVLGIDCSEDMLDIARREAPEARFQVGSFASAQLPPCDAVTAVGEVLNYLPDEAPGGELVPIFKRIREALRPGGAFVLDLAGPGRVTGGPVRDWHAGDDWAILVETEEDPAARLLTRRMITFRDISRGGYRRRSHVHRQRLHRSDEALADLREAGFRGRALRGYGDERYAPGHAVFAAYRPG